MFAEMPASAKQIGADVYWPSAIDSLNKDGIVILRKLLPPDLCHVLTQYYDEPSRFRARIKMQAHGFGSGEYQYFAYPLPDTVQKMRQEFYAKLRGVAADWGAKLQKASVFPKTHAGYVKRCHRAKQTRPTPLILKYVGGDFNRLHQDIYGTEAFPFQLTICLSRPSVDFTGGEFILTEQRPRTQIFARALKLGQGDAIIFPNQAKPVPSRRGFSKVIVKHGVSPIESGERFSLGVIFHDAA
jgi:hypothetical protein